MPSGLSRETIIQNDPSLKSAEFKISTRRFLISLVFATN